MSYLSRLGSLARLLLLLAFAAGSTGCARLLSSYDVAPNGMPRRDYDLRRQLATGQLESAFDLVGPKGEAAPDDELLHHLYGGIVAHYLGALDSSNAALERAAELAEERYTKRVSRAALSLITNDKALPYEPGETERLLVHYYGALNFLRQGDSEGAAVEARRLSSLLERAGAPRDTAFAGWLRYFAGVVFEIAGEWNDSDVAYRNAHALLGVDAPARGKAAGPDGEIVVIVEEGFIAHRVEQAIVVPLYDFEIDRLSRGETSKRLEAAALISARILTHALGGSGRHHHYYYTGRPRTIQVPPLPRHTALRECEAYHAEANKDQKSSKSSKRSSCDLGTPYLLRLAWPVLRRDPTPSRSLRVVARSASEGAEGGQGSVIAEATSPTSRLRTNLSDAAARDFDGERSGILARTILRGVAKAAVTRGIQKAPGEDHEGWGRVLGAIFNIGTALLEQADTRSWQLLPDQIRLLRLQLPPGEHDLTLEIAGAGGAPQRIELGTVRVGPGEVRLVSTRYWR